MLYTVNVEEERTFIPEPQRQAVQITDDSEGQSPFIPKLQDSNSKINGVLVYFYPCEVSM